MYKIYTKSASQAMFMKYAAKMVVVTKAFCYNKKNFVPAALPLARLYIYEIRERNSPGLLI